MSASSRVRITDIYGMHSLVISRTEAADTGLYTATASNHVGSESCSAQLHVQGELPTAAAHFALLS